MPSGAEPTPPPFSFEVDSTAGDAVSHLVAAGAYPSVAALVEVAVGRFDFNSWKAPVLERRQLSVRLDPVVRSRLDRFSRSHGVSLGQLIRVAVEALIQRERGQPRTSTQPTHTMPAAKKTAKKVAAKKAPAKKAAAPKAPAKKAAAPKAPAKKAVAKKAVAKKK